MKRRLFLFGLFLFAFLPGIPWAQSGDAGTESPFALGVDARAIGLGRAYTGIAEDASAIVWNPGGLAFLEKKELASLYVPLYDGTDYAFLSFAYPIARSEVVGLGIMGLSTRGIPKTDSFDNSLGEFYDLQLQAMLSYSRIWWDNLAGGLNVKVYHHTLDTFSGTGIGLDAGLYYSAKDWLPGLTVGVAATNALPPRVTLVSDPDIYPLNLRAGAAYRLAFDPAGDHRLLLSAEGEKSEYISPKLHGGVEYTAFHLLSLRGGWDNDHATAGAGITFYDWRLDYAIAFQPEAGTLNFFTLGWKFGLSLQEAEAANRREIIAMLAHSKADEHNRKGLEFQRHKNYQKAIDEFEKALSWVDDSAEIAKNLREAQKANASATVQERYQAGLQYYDKGFYIDALVAWREVVKTDPNYPGVAVKIAAAKKAMAGEVMQTKKAIATKKAKRAAPGEALLREGIDLYLNERYDQAIAKWEACLRINPKLTEARLYLARVREQMRSEAPAATPVALKAEVQAQIDQNYELGLTKYRQRQFVEAKSAWNKVLDLNPEHPGAKRGMERIEAILKVFEERGIK